MTNDDRRFEILQGFVTIQQAVRSGEPMKYLVLSLVSAMGIFSIGMHSPSAFRLVGDIALIISGLVNLGLLAAVSRPYYADSLTLDSNVEDIVKNYEAERRASIRRFQILRIASVLLMIGLAIVIVGLLTGHR